MTIEQIQYYITSAQCGSFSEAARQLFVSHSSVCRGVSALEQELGVKLLERGSRSLQCTRAGEVFLAESQALIRQTVKMKDSVARYRERQTLTIVSVGAYMPKFYERIGDYRGRHPEVELNLEQVDHLEVVRKVLQGGADLGICFSYSWQDEPTLDSLVIERGSFCALLPPRHPLSQKESLSREELLNCPELLGENPFQSVGPLAHGAHNIESILLQVKAGNGITVLPEHAAAAFGQGCVQKPIRGDVAEYQLLLCWRKGNSSQALKNAVELFRGEQQ
jgi:DNA-binding transcriptional LysR family regulator